MNEFFIKYKKISYAVLILYFLIWAFFYFKNLLIVPFHPDESTQIYMSQDFELIFNNTSELFYKDKKENPLAQNYRLLDAPITRYSIGLFRSIINQPGLNSDWDWSKSWSENLKALPDTNLLLIARLSTAIFFPASVIIFAFLVKKIFSKNLLVIFSSVLLFSLNSLFLLHTRRAMAESSMIFFLLLSLFLLENLPQKWLFLSAIPIGFAINAKQILIFIPFVGIFLIFYYFYKSMKKLIPQLILFGLILFTTFLMLNPIAWKQPAKVIPLMLTTRNELTQNQELSVQSVSPDFILGDIPSKLAALIGQLFVLPPSPQEIANYEPNLQNSVESYFSNIFHKGIIRNLITGTIIFLITLFGFLKSFAFLNWKQKIIYCSSFLLFILEVLLVLKIPFQRYYLPALPFVILFFLLGLKSIIQVVIHEEKIIESN